MLTEYFLFTVKLTGLKNMDTPSLEPGLEGSEHSEILRHLTKDPKMYEVWIIFVQGSILMYEMFVCF